MTTELKDDKTIKEEGKPQQRRITDDYIRIGRLCREAINTLIPDDSGGEKRLASLRLLTAILKVDSYDTAYDAILRRDKNEEVSKEFQGVKAGRPRKNIIEMTNMINPKLLQAMRAKKISPQKWCQLYDAYQNPDDYDDPNAKTIDAINVLCYPDKIFDKSGATVLSLLREDFPEAYGLDLTEIEFKTAGVNTGEKYDIFFSKKAKRYIHVYESETLGIKVTHKRRGEALRHFNWRVARIVALKRLQILLETEDLKEALKWAPKKKDNIPPEQNEKKRKDSPIETKMKLQRLVDRERKLLTDKIKELEKKRSNLRSDDRLIADKRAQYDIDLQKLRRELDSFLKEYS